MLQDSNKKILETLEADSEVLDNIHEDFIDTVSEHDIRIHSFQGGRGVSGMKGVDGKVYCPFLGHTISDYANRRGRI